MKGLHGPSSFDLLEEENETSKMNPMDYEGKAGPNYNDDDYPGMIQMESLPETMEISVSTRVNPIRRKRRETKEEEPVPSTISSTVRSLTKQISLWFAPEEQCQLSQEECGSVPPLSPLVLSFIDDFSHVIVTAA
ncbi:hypothetical protein PMAYCL1PPCAC_18111, partial [Pristionchus mayeri]